MLAPSAKQSTQSPSRLWRALKTAGSIFGRVLLRGVPTLLRPYWPVYTVINQQDIGHMHRIVQGKMVYYKTGKTKGYETLQQKSLLNGGNQNRL